MGECGCWVFEFRFASCLFCRFFFRFLWRKGLGRSRVVRKVEWNPPGKEKKRQKGKKREKSIVKKTMWTNTRMWNITWKEKGKNEHAEKITKTNTFDTTTNHWTGIKQAHLPSPRQYYNINSIRTISKPLKLLKKKKAHLSRGTSSPFTADTCSRKGERGIRRSVRKNTKSAPITPHRP